MERNEGCCRDPVPVCSQLGSGRSLSRLWQKRAMDVLVCRVSPGWMVGLAGQMVECFEDYFRDVAS